MGIFTERELSFSSEDGFALKGSLFSPESPKAAVLLAPATGIRRRFYKKFATHLAQMGFGVLSFDNRGIGESKMRPVHEESASLIDWGSLDMPAALEALKAAFPKLPTYLIGHSAGGQLVGLMPNAQDLSGFLTVASSSGSLRKMKPLYQLKARFFLQMLLPLTVKLQGVGRSDLVGMGEPLPKHVALQWGRWCAGKGYIETEFGQNPRLATHHYADLSLPSCWLYATDDDIANQETVLDMVRVYAALSPEVLALKPAEFNLKAIGHMGFFREERLWSLTTDWLEQQLNQPALTQGG